MNSIVTIEMLTEFSKLGYDGHIKKSIGLCFNDFIVDYTNVDHMPHDVLRRHIEKIKNDSIRFSNQLKKNYNAELYFFNNCYNLQKYITELHRHKEPSDLKFLHKYYSSHFKDIVNKLTLKYEGIKNEAMVKNKEHMKAHASEVIMCECGCSVSRRHIARHKLTKIHLDNMPQKE
jgi:hypothetical protein